MANQVETSRPPSAAGAHIAHVPCPAPARVHGLEFAEHVKRWFAPAGFTIPQARVEMRVGGPFEVLMRSPDGVEHLARGDLSRSSEFERLVIDFIVEESRAARCSAP